MIYIKQLRYSSILKLSPLLGLVLLSLLSTAQTKKIDGLRNQIALAKTEATKLDAILQLLPEYQTFPSDTLWNYSLQANKLATKLKDGPKRTLAILMQARAYIKWGNTDSAKALLEPEILKYNPANEKYRDIYFQLKQAQIESTGNSSNYKDALAAVYETLNEAEKYKDSIPIARNMNLLSVMNYDMDFVPEGRDWGLKGLTFTIEEPRFYNAITELCLNLSENYWWTGKLDSALLYLQKALKLSQKTENIYLQAQLYRTYASIYSKQKKYSEAEKAALESISLMKLIDGNRPQQDKLQVLASIYRLSNQIDKAISILKEGFATDTLANAISPHSGKGQDDADLQKVFYYQELARCYHIKGDSKNYEACLEKIIEGKDAFNKDNSTQAIAELQTKYEVQKKEATIARQSLAITKENYLIYFSTVFLLLIGIIAFLLFRDYRRKQKIALQQIIEEEKRNSAEAVGFAKETERKRIAADLHDNLGAQLSYIKRNVNFIIDQPKGFSPEDGKKYLTEVNDTAQNAMIDLRETIWVLNKDEVNIQEFTDKLKSYLRQQLLGKENIKLDFKELIDVSWKLSSSHSMHIFRITQEAISNIIKHSNANTITIKFESHKPETFRLAISDNGEGFDTKEKFENHYGLENMSKRAKELNAKFSIESTPSKGTRVILEKP